MTKSSLGNGASYKDAARVKSIEMVVGAETELELHAAAPTRKQSQ